MNRYPLLNKHPLVSSVLMTMLFMSQPVTADGLASDYDAIPPVISLAGSNDKPNIMVILDNSNSMDEAADGSAVGSNSPNSKSEIARNAIKGIINNFGDSMRMGLMAYDQDSISLRQLHDSQYDVSFDPNNYDKTYTGNRDSSTKAKRIVNPTDSNNFIHYNIALPFYSSTNDGNAFCYSSKADFDNGTEDPNNGPWDRYDCYDTKTGSSDNATDGMSNLLFSTRFLPTDSDIAQNILDFGTFLTWQHIGPSWFANTSPGGGEVHVGISDIDLTDNTATSQKTKLLAKLATSQFSTTTDTPLRNAGLTPIQGTLLDSKNYFSGFTSANVCTASDDYVIMVTDGLPSVDKDGNKTTDTAQAIADAAAAAASLLTDGIKTYVIGFALPKGVDPTVLDKIAVAGGTGKAFPADDANTLNAALNGIFLNIINRASSGTGAAVLANNSRGDGAFYQALYVPFKKDLLGNEVTWAGVLNGLFIDQFGKLREDTNGNKQIDDYATDKIVEYYYDDIKGLTFARLITYADPNDPSTASTVKDVDLEDLKYIWSARDQLANIPDANITTQRNYTTSAATGRTIYTSVNGSSLIDFVHNDATNSASIFSYLEQPTTTDAENTVRWIRGEEISGFRSRKLDWTGDSNPEVWRLGDIIHSTPVIVSSPRDRYDLSQGDPTYAAFVDKYYNRRHVIYVGANDGMLHAFNAGFWDDTNKAYKTDNAFSLATGVSTVTAHPLGTELWSYVPKAVLPHLKWLTSSAYSHTYYVDGEPLTFDANVFTADTDHPNGWGTILVVPMRLGGGEFSVDTDNDGIKDEKLRSSIIIFDITNPEVAPKLMAEISHTDLGFTTSKPALVKARIPSPTLGFTSPTVDRWLLAFGSGPSELDTATTLTGKTAKLFLYDLESLSFVSGYNPLDLGDDASYVGDIGVADWDSDYVDDAIYFGVNKGLGATETGRLARIRLDSGDTTNFNETNWLSKGANAGKGTLINTQRTMLGAPLTVRDDNGKRWIYGGTGRLFVAADNATDIQQKYFGVMEPVDASGIETLATVTESTLEDVTDIRVFTNAEVDRNGNTFDIPSGTTINNFNQLESAIPKHKQGWLHKLTHTGSGNPSGRNINGTARFKSLLLYTEYVPNNDNCKPEGTSELHAVHYKTGTAAPYDAIGIDATITKNSGELVLSGLDLGKGLASVPTIINDHAIIYKSTGEIEAEEIGKGGARGGRESWQEIEMDGINL